MNSCAASIPTWASSADPYYPASSRACRAPGESIPIGPIFDGGIDPDRSVQIVRRAFHPAR